VLLVLVLVPLLLLLRAPSPRREDGAAE